MMKLVLTPEAVAIITRCVIVEHLRFERTVWAGSTDVTIAKLSGNTSFKNL